MTRLAWSQAHDYEIGVDRGVFYPQSGPGEAWNGLISVVESPSEIGNSDFWIDGAKATRKNSRGEFSGNISTVSYPPSFYRDILSQTRARPFGFSYRTMTGTSYKIHIVYNMLLAPSAFVHQTSGTDTYSWNFTTLEESSSGSWFGPARVAHLVVEVSDAYSETISALEDVLYGTDSTDPSLPSPDDVLQIFEDNSILQIIDHGDGTWTAIGPDDVIIMLDPTIFEITWPSAVYISADAYTIHSL